VSEVDDRRQKLERLRSAGIEPYPHAFPGVTPIATVREAHDGIEAGDTFLLSSDGLHCCVGQNDIRSILGGSSPDVIATKLVEMSLDHGAPDNVTVVAVRFREATLLDVTQSADSQ